MTVFIVLVSILVMLMIYCRIETKWLKTTVYTTVSEKIPEELSGKRIVLLSDLHNTYFGKKNEKLIQMIKNASPDVIIIAGDVINGRSSAGQFKYAAETFTKLAELNIPLYYAFGNHECKLDGFYNKDGIYKQFCELGEKYTNLLNNGSAMLQVKQGKNITVCPKTAITGLVLPLSQFRPKAKYGLEQPVSSFIGEAGRDNYNILIAHDPTYFNEYMEWGADLVVSGHIHGGIIRLPWIGGIISPRYCLFPKYDKGIYTTEDSRSMIVSGGIGWHSIPFRFLNRPEIVAIDLIRKR